MEDGFACPQCGAALDVTPTDVPQEIACPHCATLTVIPAVAGGVAPPDASAPVDDREDELSGVRIRQLSAARRAAYRSRSHCVVGALACVVAVVQLTWNGIRSLLASGFGARPIAYLLVAGIAVWGAVFFFRKAMELDREAKRSDLPAATTEPDFTPLSDGSQQWKNLDEVR
jgi:hypothetical protein